MRQINIIFYNKVKLSYFPPNQSLNFDRKSPISDNSAVSYYNNIMTVADGYARKVARDGRIDRRKKTYLDQAQCRMPRFIDQENLSRNVRIT